MTYGYDSKGQLKKLTDANGKATTFAYTSTIALGRLS
jgi:uncharacterized protein RhaS with RHS repeats